MPDATPACPYCGNPTIRVTGETLFPSKPDIRSRRFVRCDPCDAHVACHEKTGEPMGTPANRATRQARAYLHKTYLDPLWQTAIRSGGYTKRDLRYGIDKIVRTARNRVYIWLGVQMGMTRTPHVGEFSIEECHRAAHILKDADYATIRRLEQTRAKRAQRVRSMLRAIIPHASEDEFAAIARENEPRHPILNPATERGPFRLTVLPRRASRYGLCIAHSLTRDGALAACRLIEKSDEIEEIRLEHAETVEVLWRNETLPALPPEAPHEQANLAGGIA